MVCRMEESLDLSDPNHVGQIYIEIKSKHFRWLKNLKFITEIYTSQEW
jgi:hypothetical protein